MLHIANYLDRFHSLLIEDYQISFTQLIKKHQKPIAVVSILALSCTEAGNQMLHSAGKTALYSTIGAFGGIFGAYLIGPALYYQNNPRPLILGLVPLSASGFAIANAVLSIPEDTTGFQKISAVPMACLVAGISGFFMGKSYAVQKGVEGNRKPNGRDFAIGGVRAGAFISLASLLTGGSVSLTGAMASCALIGNTLAYKQNA